MPYRWRETDGSGEQNRSLELWAHRSLPPRGRAAFVLVTFVLLLLPLVPVIGTVLLWGLLPFLMLALGGLWFALERSHRNRGVRELLTLTDTYVRLQHHDAAGQEHRWDCNRHWVTVHLYESGGPVPYYVTLRGEGREVELGAFLSEDERVTLYHDLRLRLRGT